MDIINIFNIDDKKIIFSKPIKYENKFKIKVHITDNNTNKLNKLCLITPMFELNINWKTLKYQSFKVNLDPLYGNILDFYNLITKIEDHSLEELMKYFGDNCIFKSTISEIVQFNDLFMDDRLIDDQFINNRNDDELFTINVLSLRLLKSTNVFDVNGKKTNINDIELNGMINYKFLLELTELWYDMDTKLCGCNFNVIQIKYFPNCYEHDLISNSDNFLQIINYDSQDNSGKKNSIVNGKGKGKGKGIPPPPPSKMNINIISTNISSTIIEAPKDIKPYIPLKTSLSLDPDTLKNAIANLKKVPI
jgi:hypothetical protein